MTLNKRLRHNYDNCLNCEAPLIESDSFCGKCGQKRTTGRISFGQLVIQFIEDTINWDARLFRSIRGLLVPGKLTIEYFKGHHVGYWQPLRLFLFLAALQMLVVNVTFNKVNDAVQKANESVKRDVYNYLLLKQLDTLKIDVIKGFANKNTANSAIDSLLVAYVHPERFKKTQLSKKILTTKQDSVRAAVIAEMIKEGESIDSSEVEESVKDFTKDFIKAVSSEKKFLVDMQSDSLEIPFVRVKKALLPRVEYDTTGTMKSAGWNVKFSDFTSSAKKIEGSTSFNDNDEKSSSLAITKLDFIKLNSDEIIKKYQVDGFINQVIAKQTIKAMKDGKSAVDFFLSRLLWMMIIMMPIFALFLELVNRPYYYVEHVIFSFHCHSFLFFIVSITFFISHNFIPETWAEFRGVPFSILLLYVLYYFYKAMRNVYQQGRLKTMLKYIFLLGSYFFTIMIAIVLTFIVSFFFF
jgi:Protein of unknown function (DUF3667)